MSDDTDLLLVLCESFVDDLTDTRVQTLQFLVLGGDIRRGGLRREYAHEAREEGVDRTDHLRVGAGHARSDTTLERLEAQQDHLLPLSTRRALMRSRD